MQHLDAILALALTMGAFATVVTIILEIIFRIYCIRARNLKTMFEEYVLEDLKEIELSKSFQDTGIFSGGVLDEIVNNPAKPEKKDFSLVVQLRSALGSGFLGSTISAVLFPPRNGHLYERVSLEHFLRSLVDRKQIKTALENNAAAAENLRAELTEALMEAAIAFDKMSGAMTQKFKENARKWTIVIGVVLAFGVNIDGVRIFDAYLNNEELTAGIIEQQDALQAQNTAVSARFDEIRALQERIAELQAKINNPDENATEEEKNELTDAIEELAPLVSPQSIQNIAANATGTLIKLQEAGVPIGWQYYPWNLTPESCGSEAAESQNSNREGVVSDENQGGGTDQAESSTDEVVSTGGETAPENNTSGNGTTDADESQAAECDTEETEYVVSWFFKVLVTGLLIGLGGPFWFDLAKRLSAVRNVMRGKASAEAASGEQDTDGNAVSLADLDKKVRAIVDILLPK